MREGADARPLPDRDAGAEDDVRLDRDVAAEPGVGAQKHGLRRHQGGAPGECGAAQPGLHQRLGFGEFEAAVDPDQLLRRQLDHPAGEPVPGRQPDDARQVEFALGVVAVECQDEPARVPRLDQHQAAPNQPDRPLLRSGVGGFDDAVNSAVRPGNEPAVGAGIRGPHPGQEHGGRRPPLLVEQRRQAGACQQRGVAIEHQHRVDLAFGRQAVAERFEPDADGVAGAERRVLHRGLDRRDKTGDFVHPRADYGDA